MTGNANPLCAADTGVTYPITCSRAGLPDGYTGEKCTNCDYGGRECTSSLNLASSCRRRVRRVIAASITVQPANTRFVSSFFTLQPKKGSVSFSTMQRRCRHRRARRCEYRTAKVAGLVNLAKSSKICCRLDSVTHMLVNSQILVQYNFQLLLRNINMGARASVRPTSQPHIKQGRVGGGWCLEIYQVEECIWSQTCGGAHHFSERGCSMTSNNLVTRKHTPHSLNFS